MSARLAVKLREFSGARAVRLSDAPDTSIAEHAHDWPVVSLFVLGSYRNRSALGETNVSSPSAMFYRAGERHSNVVGDRGLEQVDLEFDPEWLGFDARPNWAPVLNWHGGASGLAARRLARLWSDPTATESTLSRNTAAFLHNGFASRTAPKPSWLPEASRLIGEGARGATEIARRLDLHPGWFAEAYRQAVGEGVGDTLRRLRVETAVQMLTGSQEAQAQVAAAAGFCDQSHMIRSFRTVLGRTPGEVRAERKV